MNIKLIDNIKKLRLKTGLSIIECKKALLNNNMDIDKAIIDLKKLGLLQASLKSHRSTTAGLTSLLINDEKKKAIMSEVNCETDFVARSAEFIDFTNEINRYFINDNNIENELISFQDGYIMPKIVEEKRQNIIAQLGENIIINRIRKIITHKYFITGYNHKLGDLCRISAILLTDNFNTEHNNLCVDLTMQIAAMNPKYLSKKDIPNTILEIESNIKSFITENVLLEQDFIKDRSLLIKNIIMHKFEIIDFFRFEVGEKEA